MRSKCCVIVAIASQNGNTKISSNAIVITATASPRLCQSRSWTCSMMGQVATTRVVAQITAGKNGHNIQNEAAIRPPTKRTASVVRVSSECACIPRSTLRHLGRDRIRTAPSAAADARRGRASRCIDPGRDRVHRPVLHIVEHNVVHPRSPRSFVAPGVCCRYCPVQIVTANRPSRPTVFRRLPQSRSKPLQITNCP